MQTTTATFTQLANGHVRPVSASVRASFDKSFDPSITFFTLDVSILDGPDILGPTGDNPVQLWDQYAYTNYDSKLISAEVVRQELEPYSVAQAFADVTLNNYDSYFTPNSGSPIQSFILPRRPFRLNMGFGGEMLQQIVGLSDGMPEIDKAGRTASFHIIDFMSYLFDKDIGESILLENVTTGEVLDYLFQYLGLSTDQYVLDESFNTIAFFFVERDTRFGDVASKLLEAEIGRLYLDETGVIRFKNRYSYDMNPVMTFDKSNTIDYQESGEDLIINSVKIIIKVREVQPSQSIWTSSTVYPIKVGESIDVWLKFSDPITTMTDPTYSAIETNTSYFISNLNDDGTGTYANVVLASSDLFSTTAKLTFQNTGASNAYITAIDTYGTPAKIVDTIEVIEKDQSSIDDFEEQYYEINNDYIQDVNSATARALMLINDFKNYGSVIDIDVKGSPALQLSDALTLNLDGYQGTYIITKTTNLIPDPRFRQRLRVRKKTAITFFTLDVSILDGTDVLGI
jgi:hypothetical protein